MKIIFDNQILEDGQLGEVKIEASKGKFDVVARQRDEKRVLKTFDTEADAKTWLNALGDKLVKEDGISTLDAR